VADEFDEDSGMGFCGLTMDGQEFKDPARPPTEELEPCEWCGLVADQHLSACRARPKP
jgi:hypothetical protein